MSKLHPQIEAVLKAQAAAGLRPIEALTPAEARAQMEETARARKAEPTPVARVEERMISRAPPARSGCASTGHKLRRRSPRSSTITAAGM